MKKISTMFLTVSLLALLITATLTVETVAQTQGGPDTYGYIWRDSNDPNGPSFTWIDVTQLPGATQVVGMGDDNIRGPYTIGFPFHYYWYDVTTFYAGSNGYLGFTPTPVSHPFPPIPTPAFIQNYLGGLTTDLTFTDGSQQPIPNAEAWYWTNNTDTLILSYNSVPFWAPPPGPGYSGENTFQIILSGVDSSITYNYLLQNGASASTNNFCTVGIENVSGNIGLQWGQNIYPPSVYAIKFYYPSNTTYQVSDASTVYNNNPETGARFLSQGGGGFTMNTQIKNTGNQALTPFNVFSRVVNGFNQIQASETVQSMALSPNQTEDITFTTTYNPTTAGTFRYINDTQLPGDATPTNNQKIMELQVVDTTAASILLTYDNGLDAGLGGLGWSGGGGGTGIEIIPPFYPCNMTQVRAFIAANANQAGFSMLVLDDDGPNGGPGTVLDSVGVPGTNVLIGSWNNVTLTTPLQIDSGSVFVAWMMGGDGISIGQNQLPPFSNRTYEILGNASNPSVWAAYRYREIEDVMINAYISALPVGIGEQDNLSQVGNIYPNPANEIVRIDYSFTNFSGEVVYQITNLSGQLVASERVSGLSADGTLQLDVTNIPQGIYMLELQSGNDRYTRKLTVIR
jgi:hypothetical protein